MRFSSFLTGFATLSGLAHAATLTTPPNGFFADTCLSLDVNLKILGIVFGKIDVCLCISAIPAFVKSNTVALGASKVLGEAKVVSYLTSLVNDSKDCETCNYPDHAVPTCGKGCVFDCKPPYVKKNGKCVLPPSSRKRSLSPAEQAQCPWGLQKCGVASSTSSRVGFECLDTKTNLESCGGCSVPFNTSLGATGVDCTAIEGVADVGCIAGACVVRRCYSGWALSEDGTSCIQVGWGAPTLAEQTVW